MKKTEESLRRLKKGQTTTFSLFRNPNSGKDEESRDQERIRTQMIIDVNAFGKDAESVGVDVLASQAFTVLNEMVHEDVSESTFFRRRFIVVCSQLLQALRYKLNISSVHSGRGFRMSQVLAWFLSSQLVALYVRHLIPNAGYSHSYFFSHDILDMHLLN